MRMTLWTLKVDGNVAGMDSTRNGSAGHVLLLNRASMAFEAPRCGAKLRDSNQLCSFFTWELFELLA